MARIGAERSEEPGPDDQREEGQRRGQADRVADDLRLDDRLDDEVDDAVRHDHPEKVAQPWSSRPSSAGGITPMKNPTFGM